MRLSEIEQTAKNLALRAAPTELGMFDARKRLETYIIECLKYGLIVMIGCSFLLTDDEVERALDELNIREET